MFPRTHYAKSDDVHIAYQVFGNGETNIVFVPGFVSHIENYWEEPGFARWLRRLGDFSRVVIFDKRGTGLSDHVSELPDMDHRMDDVRAVMDAAGMQSAAILGVSEGGSLASFFAATYPERTQALVLYGAFAKFSSWFPNDESLEQFTDYIDDHWGSGESVSMFAPSKKNDKAFQQWWGRFERLGANPRAATMLMRMNSQIDISDILPSISVPTLIIHKIGDVTVNVEGGRNLAANIPNARLVELPGRDHLPWVGESAHLILTEIEQFLTGEKTTSSLERKLATVMFTDIVGSTQQVETLGDQAWGDLQDQHDKLVRQELRRFQGKEVRWTGDGFLASFDTPARSIFCARAIINGVRSLGVEVRVGIHTGEIEFVNDDIRGMAVHIAARVSGHAQGGEILVSRTVKDLVAGSQIAFEYAGTYTLKGIPEEWQLYRVIL